MNQSTIDRLSSIRSEMARHNIDIYIIPSSDPHLSEYVADTFKGRAYISGFTGSAGTLAVTSNEAALFTDGRYFIQAEKQIKDTGIHLVKMATAGHPTLEQWLKKRLTKNATLGYDGRLFSVKQIKTIKEKLTALDLTYSSDKDLIDAVWSDRPALPDGPAFLHEHLYTGAHIHEKLDRIRRSMNRHDADTYLLNSLNDIAWLFNIRGNDVASTPVVYAYAIVTDMTATLYIDKNKLSTDLLTYLDEEGVSIKNYENYYLDLGDIKQRHIIYDPGKVNALMIDSLGTSNHFITATDLTLMEKACFTDHELKNMKQAHIKDGVAMVQFLHWLDNNVSQGITELDAMNKAEHFRSLQKDFIEPSFESIPAYAANAAMMHYSTPRENSPTIEPKGLFLLDSGGQYKDGTTDITRTTAVGPLTDEEKKDFTLVLKAHIALNRMIFLSGITGTNLDAIARQPIWAERMDYKCGTGHGVGYVLSVHDGPARIGMQKSDVVIKSGMILTNEPGIYKQDKHGIRTENVMVVKELETNSDGTFLNFEVISFCPIDKRAINSALLNETEIKWLNDYHQTVYNQLSSFLDEATCKWLEQATSPIQ